MELAGALLKFAIVTAVIVIAGIRLSRYGDIIAEKTGLGGAWIGIVMLATATSLPELITGSTAVAVVGVPDLALGDAFGSNLFNLLIIAVLDVLDRGRPILSQVRLAHIVSGAIGILLIGTAVLAIFLSTLVSVPAIGWVGIYTPVLLIAYILGIRLVYYFEKQRVVEYFEEEVAEEYGHTTLRAAYIGYAVSAAFIVAAGVWLAFIGDELAQVTGLGSTFVGTLLIAGTTSMPEVVTSIAALRLGARDMAVANMLGSNMFNMGIVLAVDDLVLVRAPLMTLVDVQHIFTGFLAMIMTAVVIVGVVFRSQKNGHVGWRWETVLLIAIYVAGMATLYSLRG